MEREYRAAVRSLGLFVVCAVLFSIPTFLFTALAGIVFPVSLAAFILVVLAISAGPRPRSVMRLHQIPERIDERDVIFARFDLNPESPHYSAYYARRPDLKEVDDRIRALPDLFSPEHMAQDPVLQTLGEAEFSFLEHQLSIVDGQVGGMRWEGSAEISTGMVKSVVKYLGADQVGISRLAPEDIYSHVGRGPEAYGEEIINDHSFAISFTVEMQFPMIQHAPQTRVIVETAKQYVEAARISIILADFLRRLGYAARAHIAGSNYQALLVPAAWRGGLGELGRIGMLMTPHFGPRVRLGLVTTGIPLITDLPITFGAQRFCEICRKCAANCPAQAIPRGDRVFENGVEKWVIDREACYRYWRKVGTDCARCVYVCPYSKPANAFHDSIRAVASRSALAQRLLSRGDDFFYGKAPRVRRSENGFII